MKDFNELPERELAVLTDEELRTYIQYGCMYAGIQLPEFAPVEPIKPAITKDVRCTTSATSPSQC
jgi:hypothetical protein